VTRADGPRPQAFGDWDAPVTDGAYRIDVPEYRECAWCGERFRPGDAGAIQPAGHAEHKECSLRNVMGGIGHHVDHARYCHGPLGPDAGLTRRLSAILVWGLLVERLQVTDFDLANLRGDGDGA
jgi:hypothetical protein